MNLYLIVIMKIKKLKKGLIRMDGLEELFDLQIKFQQLLGYDIFPPWLDLFDNIELIKNQLLALFSEVGEALKEVPWKPWKKNQDFNVAKFKIELIDVFHFLINLFLLSGMNSNDVIELFKTKNEINVRRQKNGY